MWAKILAAFSTPILAVVLVVAVLNATHHTALPDMALPSLPPTANYTASEGVAKPMSKVRCLGNMPRHFAGLAVEHDISGNSASFQKVTGHEPQIVEFYNPFLSPFAVYQARKIVNAGEIPLIQLDPVHAPIRKIAAGDYDGQLTKYAKAVREFGCAVVLSMGHEMNGWWYPWGRPQTDPADFIAAWRHVHDLFAKLGVRNVIWSWDPSHQYSAPTPDRPASLAREWYPGSKYVDWVGLDGYLGYDKNGHPQNFDEIFGVQLHDIRQFAPGKPVYIAETGVVPGSAALSQIRELFRGVVSYRLAGLIWFDAIGQRDQQGIKKDYMLQHKRFAAEAAIYKKQLSDFLK
ncbi:MAG: glycoside hydrolase family 26 protein [Streptosporangiaceae bacterium]